MKILIVCVSKFTFDKFIKRSAKELQDIGFDVTIGLGEEIQNNQDIYEGFKFIKLPLIRRGGIFNFLSSIYKTSKTLKKENYNYINVHTPSAAFLVRWAALFHINTKIIYTVHGFYFHEGMRTFSKFIHIFSEALLSLRTSKFLLVSREDYSFIKKLLFFKSKSAFHFIPNKIDSDIFSYRDSKRKIYRNKINLAEDTILFGMVCRINQEKGVIEFLKAAIKLQKVKEDCQFIIVGDLMRDENKDEFVTHFKKLNKILGNKLHITGFVDDVDGYLSAMDVFCLPSYREGYPVSLIEASVAGCSCIASNIRGCREISFENSNSTLIEPRDVPSLFKAMLHFCKHSQIDHKQRRLHSYSMSKKFNLPENFTEQSIIIRDFINISK